MRTNPPPLLLLPLTPQPTVDILQATEPASHARTCGACGHDWVDHYRDGCRHPAGVNVCRCPRLP